MGDDLDPELEEDELDEDALLGGKKAKTGKGSEEESLDDLAEGEDDLLPEDAFDDVEPEDLW